MQQSVKIIPLLLACCHFFPGQSTAQHYFEVRGAQTKYRYADYNYTFRNAAIVDLFYVGVPGSNELNLGGGYGFKPRPSLTIAPMLYAVLGKEDGQRGIKTGILVTFEEKGWKLASFLAHYSPVRGNVSRYQVLDTLDASRVLGRGWDAGISAGFFHSGGTWNPQVGPLIRKNDRLGAWAMSWRFGPQKEFRLTRVLLAH